MSCLPQKFPRVQHACLFRYAYHLTSVCIINKRYHVAEHHQSIGQSQFSTSYSGSFKPYCQLIILMSQAWHDSCSIMWNLSLAATNQSIQIFFPIFKKGDVQLILHNIPAKQFAPAHIHFQVTCYGGLSSYDCILTHCIIDLWLP